MGIRAILAAFGCVLLLSPQAWAERPSQSDDQYGLVGVIGDILMAPCYLLFELCGGGSATCAPPQRCYVVCVPAKETGKKKKLRTGDQYPPTIPRAPSAAVPPRQSQQPPQPPAAVPLTKVPAPPRPAEVPAIEKPYAQPKVPPFPSSSAVPAPQIVPPEEVQPITPKSMPDSRLETPARVPVPRTPSPAVTEIPKVEKPAMQETPRIEKPAMPVPQGQSTQPVPTTRDQVPKPEADKVVATPKAPEPKAETKRRSGKQRPSCGGYYPPVGCYPRPW